jgi:sugar phosphate isomerase/epimerase
MKLGLINSAWAQAGRDTAYGIRMTKQIGFDSIDIFADPLDIDAKERRLIRKECETAGLPVVKHSLGELGVALAAAVHALAATPNARPAHQAYGALLIDDVVAGFGGAATNYSGGHLTVPTGPGLGVELDHDRVERYAELYRREGAGFGFHDRERVHASAALPKF